MKKLLVVAAALLMSGCVYYPYYGDYSYPYSRPAYPSSYSYVYPSVSLFYSSRTYGHSPHYFRHGHGNAWHGDSRHGKGWHGKNWHGKGWHGRGWR